MIYPPILDRQYQQYRPLVDIVAKRVKSTMLNFCDDKGYALTSRIKTIESLAEKIETGRFKKWSELNDLFACTVIIPSLLQEQEVIEFCQNTFDVDVKKIVKRGQNKKSPDSFIFDSTRIYARLRRAEAPDLSNLSIFDILFEIQIKSAFEHAWAVSTHDLVYKSAEIDWKKLRLAAQIKATVEQLDTMIMAFEQIASTIQEHEYPQIKRKRQIAVATQNLFAQKIPQELQPKDMSRFCDNLYGILASAGKEDKIQEAIKCIRDKVNSTPTDLIPRSISLLQYFLAILVEEKIIVLPLDKHCFHITEELIALYPIFRDSVNSIFQYDM